MFRVMVVEDDSMIREILKHALESSGFEVMVCDTGSTADFIAACAKPPDVLLCDMFLPGGSGI